jgi:putative sugar O-methyltransferase
MDDIDNFRNRLSHILNHWRRVSSGGTGEYWDKYVKAIVRQVNIEEGDITSYKWFNAATFSGGYQLAPEFSEKARQYPQYFYAILRRLPNPFGILNPLWRLQYKWSLAINTVSKAHQYRNILLNYGEHLFQKQLNEYNIASPQIMGDQREKLNSGRWLSYKTLRDFNIFLQIVKQRRTFDTVVEIGCGIGELARIFCETNTARRYILIDIPPTIAFSERYLEKTIGESLIDRFDDKRASLDYSKRVHILTPDQIEVIPRFTLGINVASFGEMTKDVVTGYINELKKKGFDEFVSINQRIGKASNRDRFGEELYAQEFGPEYAITQRNGFVSNAPVIESIPDNPGAQGYQFLRFESSESQRSAEIM